MTISMKQSAGKMFISGFIKSIFIVAFLLGAGILSYKVIMHFWQGPEEEAVVAFKDEPVSESITEARIDSVSKNLIYCYDDKTNEISKIVLEIFHCEKKQLTYITIPLRTKFTMSDTLYRELILVHPAIPQVMKLSSMTKYLDTETIFDYGVLIIEDLLGITISYYTTMPQSTFDNIFTEKNETSVWNEKTSKKEKAEQMIPVVNFTAEYIDFIKTLDDAEKISTYIEKIYPEVQSNLALHEKMNYLESYCETPFEHISFDLIRGEDENSAYRIDINAASVQLQKLTEENDFN